MTGSQWFLDANSEWFSVVAARQSVATLQGYEWLGKSAWDAQSKRNAELQVCAYATKDCVEAWIRTNDLADAWLYVPVRTIDTTSPTGDCCAGLRASLRSSSKYVGRLRRAGRDGIQAVALITLDPAKRSGGAGKRPAIRRCRAGRGSRSGR